MIEEVDTTNDHGIVVWAKVSDHNRSLAHLVQVTPEVLDTLPIGAWNLFCRYFEEGLPAVLSETKFARWYSNMK